MVFTLTVFTMLQEILQSYAIHVRILKHQLTYQYIPYEQIHVYGILHKI